MNLTVFQGFLKSNDVYKPTDIDLIISTVYEHLDCIKKRTNAETIEYYNIPCSFDIETTSFYRTENKKKCKTAIMYEWTFGIYGIVIIGRTWLEFITMIHQLCKSLGTNLSRRLVVYVHNLSFEFQFFRKYFEWSNVFALETRKPVYAVTTSGVEFRCSYILSGYSLAKCADNLTMFNIKKLVGDLDYKQIRHAKTLLTEAELQYCINDVKIVMAYIAECIINDGNIARIPLTSTGYVRKYCRRMCLTNDKDNKYRRYRYKQLISGLTIDPDEYKQLQRAFMGGFTHANPFMANKIINDVTSYDFTSSYPTVIIAERFPMSKAEKIDITSRQQLDHNLKCYCCLFDVEFENITPRLWFDNYISESRCFKLVNPIVNNGRVVSADTLATTITEQDFFIIQKFYKWTRIKIANFRRYKRGYLPTDFIKSVLKLYADKTQLKDVDGKEIEYLKSKGMLNSCYGMMVTNIVREEITYLDDWVNPVTPDLQTKINEYNNDTNRFMFYPWGVWVTAYARRNLFTGIREFGNDYIYADTDSVKCRNVKNHIDYINKYNQWIIDRLYKAMRYHNLPVEMVEPITINGDKKPLGIWSFDGHYKRFKTLGAKRYLCEYSDDPLNGKKAGKINLTVSGLNKKTAVPYMVKNYDDVFTAFSDELYIPCGQTGKLTHTYIDDPVVGTVTDYLGIDGRFNELSAVHLDDADYSLNATKYINFILNIDNIFK